MYEPHTAAMELWVFVFSMCLLTFIVCYRGWKDEKSNK